MQNYSSLRMILYQENWIGHFELIHGDRWLSGFRIQVKKSHLKVNLPTVSFIEKCYLAKKCHLNLTINMINIFRHIKVHILSSYLFANSVRRWMETIYVFSYMQKQDGFLKVGHLIVSELQELCYRFLLVKQSSLAGHFSDTQNAWQNLFIPETCSTCSGNSICHLKNNSCAQVDR